MNEVNNNAEGKYRAANIMNEVNNITQLITRTK